MKEVELRVLAELMKNSRRSDRDIAKAVRVSQPTVTRTIKKLEKEGCLQEYTALPNFSKIGHHLFALTFFSWKKGVNAQESEAARRWAIERSPGVSSNVILVERGIGLNHDSFMASFHKDYSSYTKLIQQVKNAPYMDQSKLESFIVNLDDKIHYRSLTLSTVAMHLLSENERKE